MNQSGRGDPAPEFALPDANGTTHRPSDQRGRWIVLYFYPADDTPAARRKPVGSATARQHHERGADVWGDQPQGAASKRAFREKFGLPFTLLADEDHAVAAAYGAWVEKTTTASTMGTTERRS